MDSPSPPARPSLDELISIYEIALGAIAASSSLHAPQDSKYPGVDDGVLPPLSTLVLAALLARDAVERKLRQHEQGDELPTAQHYDRLIQLDGRLRQAIMVIADAIDLTDARQTVGVDQSAWWWFLELSPEKSSDDGLQSGSLDWFFNGLTVVSLVLTTTFAISTFRAFSFLGLDLLGLLTSFTQGAGLAFIAGGQFTSKGQAGIEQVYRWIANKSKEWFPRLDLLGNGLGRRLPLRRRLKLSLAGKTFGASVVLLIASSLVYYNLHRVGNLYYQWGKEERERGNNIAALRSFQKALDFSPQKVEAYSSLGQISEKMGRLDDALDYYQQGMAMADPSSALGLARITLFQGLRENGWTGKLTPETIRDVEFLLNLSYQFNQRKGVTDVIIEQETHYGLLELAKIDFTSFSALAGQEAMLPELQDQLMRIEQQLGLAHQRFQSAHLIEIQALATENREHWAELVILAIEQANLSRSDRQRYQQELQTEGAVVAIQDVLDILGFSEDDRSKLIVEFLESLSPTYQQQLRQRVIFDLGKPRCYLAVVQFLDQALHHHSLSTSPGELPGLTQAVRNQRQNAEIACGATDSSPSISMIDLYTLSIYDKTLIDKLLNLPERFLPPEVYD
jgi:tetratricopeptide (TPR) repeat protein